MLNIIITGLVRKEEMFKKSISDFYELVKKGLVDQIVFSTWMDEIQKYPGLKCFLDNNGVQVVETSEPLIGTGTILKQMKTLDVALDKIKDRNNLIFKTRPDLYIQQESLVKIMSLDYVSSIQGDVLDSRIWVPWYEISKPFYIADECFCTSYSVMKKLVNYDMRYDVLYKIDAGVSHIRRFIHPFINYFPELNIYLEYFGESGHGTPARFPIQKKFSKNKEYQYFIGLYYNILKNYFLIGLSKEDADYIEFREWSKPKNIHVKNKLIADLCVHENSFDKNRGQIYFYDIDWINEFLDKQLVTRDKLKFYNFEELKRLKAEVHELKQYSEKNNNKFSVSLKRKIMVIYGRFK